MIVRIWADGGRSPAQSPTGGPGVSDPGWQEVKVACCPTLSSTVPAADPPAPRLTAPGRVLIGPYRVRIDNLLSMFLRLDFECLQQLANFILDRLIIRALVPRRTAPQGPLSGLSPGKA